ncbi:MAG: hypothetical protein ACXWJJ_02495 [Ramlibacter sp.]
MRVLATPLLFWADGMTVAPNLVVVHPRVRGDAGLLAHEAVHARQMREVGLLRFWWWYFTCPAFRLWAEVEAYRVSLRHQPTAIRHFARAIAHGYMLAISERTAERLLHGAQAEPSAEA